jgi:hypothetical protein
MVLALGVLPGCDALVGGKGKALCEQSVGTVRQAIGFEDFESAHKWRDYAWKACDEKAILATIDKEIVDAQEAVEKRRAETAEKDKQAAQERINRANRLWAQFDRLPATKRTEASLTKVKASAAAVAAGLAPKFAQSIEQYNEKQYQKRLAALTR